MFENAPKCRGRATAAGHGQRNGTIRQQHYQRRRKPVMSSDLLALAQLDSLDEFNEVLEPQRKRRRHVERFPTPPPSANPLLHGTSAGEKMPIRNGMRRHGQCEYAFDGECNSVRVFENNVEKTMYYRKPTLNESFLNSDQGDQEPDMANTAQSDDENKQEIKIQKTASRIMSPEDGLYVSSEAPTGTPSSTVRGKNASKLSLKSISQMVDMVDKQNVSWDKFKIRKQRTHSEHNRGLSSADSEVFTKNPTRNRDASEHMHLTGTMYTAEQPSRKTGSEGVQPETHAQSRSPIGGSLKSRSPSPDICELVPHSRQEEPMSMDDFNAEVRELEDALFLTVDESAGRFLRPGKAKRKNEFGGLNESDANESPWKQASSVTKTACLKSAEKGNIMPPLPRPSFPVAPDTVSKETALDMQKMPNDACDIIANLISSSPLAAGGTGKVLVHNGDVLSKSGKNVTNPFFGRNEKSHIFKDANIQVPIERTKI